MPRAIRPLPVHPISPTARQRWGVLQALTLLATLGFVVAWLAVPEVALPLFWRGLLPIVAVLLLLAPHVWRNICPLATASMAGRDATRGLRVRSRHLPWLSAAAIALFVVAVVFRRSVFETSGPATAALVGGALLLGIVPGRLGEGKAGFCNAICPIGPVERLLGQWAVVEVGNPRCPTCTLCTEAGCLDLALDKAPAQHLGRARRSHGWLLRPWGMFGAAFPGLVAGWGVAGSAAVGPAGTATRMLLGGAVTWLLAGAASLSGLGLPRILRTSALAAAVTYAWFAWPAAYHAWEALLRG
ncbi:MAG: hypothetical protein KC544_08640 [Gemmatimonadetes bacterium]|nr:hypothetical protein [Gemmatimonadota bacterium]MCA9767562.1 hypothetical protein [Gemmatimonadota bacterium]MCB9518852.1 hypothetical protein [Gemmatimonadales bacterium]HPF62179.1 hypothetical protein [Gemmatimonadales bacterium]HRX18529.1 hypothetical protein [Gemmatimonadales bacterium]